MSHNAVTASTDLYNPSRPSPMSPIGLYRDSSTRYCGQYSHLPDPPDQLPVGPTIASLRKSLFGRRWPARTDDPRSPGHPPPTTSRRALSMEGDTSLPSCVSRRSALKCTGDRLDKHSCSPMSAETTIQTTRKTPATTSVHHIGYARHGH